ncbi:MAG: phosphotransferase [Candidatus Komeilibacteria bacterium]|nr:phosphotransferase [Candidatus Komeilibacteria bacterium]
MYQGFEIKYSDRITEDKERQDIEVKAERLINKYMEKLLKGNEHLGTGLKAEVFSLVESSICVKIIVKPDLCFNNVEQELKLMDKLYAGGINIPRPLGAAYSIDHKVSLLFMERVNGSSVEDFLLDKNLTELPQGFEVEKFFASLQKQVNKMHEVLGIHHRDLHAGNVMIDVDGQPWIIDFDKSTEHYFANEDPYIQATIPGHYEKLPQDNHLIKEMKKDAIKHFSKEKEGNINV